MNPRQQSRVLFIQRHSKEYESEPVMLVVIENPLWHIRRTERQFHTPKIVFTNTGD